MPFPPSSLTVLAVFFGTVSQVGQVLKDFCLLLNDLKETLIKDCIAIQIMVRRFLVPTKLILISGIILFCLYFLCKIGSADTITVDDDGNGDYEKIQDAIDASEDGDTIKVWEGTYYENVIVNKSVSLIGNGSEGTTIDGGGDGNVVTITADWTNISGFLVTGSGSSGGSSGIKVESDYNSIFENNCSNNYYGIYLRDSNWSTLTNNICSSNNWYGIFLSSSNNSILDNNICYSNNDDGIYLLSSSSTILRNNICSSNNDNGIRFFLTDECTLKNNTISGNRLGIYLKSSSQDNIAHNNFIFDNSEFGINAIENDGYSINATNNWWGDDSGPYHPTINPNGKGDNVTDYVLFDPWIGKLRTWYVDDDVPGGGNGSKEHPFNQIQDAIDNAMYADTIRVFNGTYYEHVVVNKLVSLIGNGSEETTIDGEEDGDVVKIASDGVIMSGFTLTNGNNGIFMVSDHNHLFEINCSHNTFSGIYLFASKNIIENNSLSNNKYGIYVWDSKDNTFANNSCSNNIRGIYLEQSSNNILTNNNCSQNHDYGIYLLSSKGNIIESNTCNSNSKDGIWLSASNYNMLFNNTCSYNNGGICIVLSRYGIFENNTISNNHNGIWLRSSHNNRLMDIMFNNNYCGIRISDSNNNFIANSIIVDNVMGISIRNSENNYAHYNKIINNTRFGISAGIVDYPFNATGNWWGYNCGPYNPSMNPNGRGDNVTDNVLIDPWVGMEEMIKYVDDDAPAGGNGSLELPFNRIQDAIDNATECDTVRVYEGLYEENVVVNKSINLIGNGSETTTIDGRGNGDVVKITADWVNLSGFLVTDSGDAGGYPGIMVESDHNHIFGNNCSNNQYGIHLRNSNACTITNNTCLRNDYVGIYLWNSNTCTITNNTCSSNYKRGIFIWNSNACTITNNTCYSNNDDGIRHSSSINCTIEDNICYSNNKNGILLEDSGYCTITNNTCEYNENGIYLWNSISDCTIEYNTCQNNNEGILLEDSSYCRIKNNICLLNDAYGIRLSDSNDCTIKNNTSLNNGGAILLYRSSYCRIEYNICSSNNNHGIVLTWYSSDCTLQNNSITRNKHGIYLHSLSQDNTAHYNNIFNNTEYGINASSNNGNTIDARYNWWGDSSGPYHPTNNSDGRGDNVTDNVDFDPWLDEYGNIYEKNDKDKNGDEEEDDNNSWILFLLIVILIILLALLSAVIIFLFIDQKPKDGL